MTSYPYLGAGIGLRREFFEALATTERQVDWLEVVSENFMGVGGRHRWALDASVARCPVIPHGVGLNLGGPDPLDPEYVEALRELTARLDAPFFSDHLTLSRLAGVYLHDLVPLPFCKDMVSHVALRIREACDRVGRPFLLENPTYYVVMPGQEMSEAEFLTRIVEEADCGLLLDINNVYVNGQNHDYDDVAFLEALPLERVGYVHMAGHTHRPAAIIDTHGAPVAAPVWALYRTFLKMMGRPVSTVIEWDNDIPSLERVLDQADMARAALAEVGG